MRGNQQNRITSAVFLTTLVAFPAAVWAGAHTWRVHELFTNSDGTIQYVEIRESGGGAGENFIGGHPITSNANSFTIPNNAVGSTSFKSVLFATSAFAALPGAPTPDYIFPAGSVPFFNKNGDTVSYVPYDPTFTFGAGVMPTDGLHALAVGLSTPCNTPTNYAGQTGTVNINCSLRGDVNGSGGRDGDDIAAFVRVKLGTPQVGDNAMCADYCTGTLTGDVQGFVNDLLS